MRPIPSLRVRFALDQGLARRPYWNADFFGGSILRYSELLQAQNQRETALEFLRTGLEMIRLR